MKNRVIVFLVIFAITSCRKSSLDYTSYMNYLADKKNGLVKENAVNGVKVRVKYLPEAYLVYNAVKSSIEAKDTNQTEIANSYANSLTFMLTIGPDEGQQFNITRLNINSYEEFAERIQVMSFEMGSYLKLKIKEKEYSPELVQLETINGPERSKNFIVVFKALDESGKKMMTDDLYFVYEDELFYTGTSKFKFRLSDIESLPQLAY
jgi:hypothetical protein